MSEREEVLEEWWSSLGESNLYLTVPPAPGERYWVHYRRDVFIDFRKHLHSIGRADLLAGEEMTYKRFHFWANRA